MEVIYFSPEIGNDSICFPFSDRGCITVLGFFDGVHIAHRALIKKGRDIAEKKGLPLVIFTFSGDDGQLKPGAARLYTDKEKLELLEDCGADFVIMADFPLLSRLDPESFAKDILISRMGSLGFVCGYNFRFGKNASADAEDMMRFFEANGLGGEIIDELRYGNDPISSTAIRSLISAGQLREAASILGLPYFITGKVNHGMGLGTGMGIPTVNTKLPAGRFSPPNGVYATLTVIGSKRYIGLTNVGLCPTFGEREAHTETYILDFYGNLYDEEIRIYFIEYLRKEKKFSSEKELLMQIEVDKNRAISLLEDLKWQEIGLSLQ